MLKVNKSLRVLDLGFNKMTEPLKCCPNRLSSEGAILLADALRINRTLVKLDLNHNNIHQAGIEALARMLNPNGEDS